MPRYIIERTVPPMSKDDIESGSKLAIQVAAEIPGVVWIRTYISEAEGKIYCEYEAPNIEALLEHARRAGLPVDKISQISLEISPKMFA
jgi:hypothetical protein